MIHGAWEMSSGMPRACSTNPFHNAVTRLLRSMNQFTIWCAQHRCNIHAILSAEQLKQRLYEFRGGFATRAEYAVEDFFDSFTWGSSKDRRADYVKWAVPGDTECCEIATGKKWTVRAEYLPYMWGSVEERGDGEEPVSTNNQSLENVTEYYTASYRFCESHSNTSAFSTLLPTSSKQLNHCQVHTVPRPRDTILVLLLALQPSQ